MNLSNVSNHGAPCSEIVVSVIVPVFNVESYIEEAIQSVLDQTYAAVELILVDDGSTDQSALLCEKYAQRYPSIKLIRQENAGVSVARNRGLSEVTGAYIFFMDSDDTIAPDFIASAYAVAKENDADIVLLGEHFIAAHPYTAAAPTCAQFLRKSFLDQHPTIRFPEGIQPCEDGLLSHQLLALTTKVATDAEALYFYRQHEQQNHIRINQDSWKVLHAIPSWLTILVDFYTKEELWDSHRAHLLRFLEHEPFKIRYFELPLDEEQKAYLFTLIRDFEHIHQLRAKSVLGEKPLSEPFDYFLKAKDHADFDRFYSRYLRRRAKERAIYLFLSKFILVSKSRRTFRQRIRKAYPI